MDVINRQDAINSLGEEPEVWFDDDNGDYDRGMRAQWRLDVDALQAVPSAEPEQRYTEEELMVFQHGISLRLLSKRSAQHWRYDEDRATEIKFLERLYDKVVADMRGEQDDQDCSMCALGNPCHGCNDYDQQTQTCMSDGGCEASNEKEEE